MKTPLPMIQEGRVLADWVTNSLREAIRNGLFDPGEKLDQGAIAETWGVSRTPIREAIRRLQAEGFLEVIPHRGAFVIQFSAEDVAEVYLVRRLLESEVVRQITPNVPEEVIDELDRVVKCCEVRCQDGQRHEYPDFDVRFHNLILQQSNSNLLKQILKELDNRSSLARVISLRYPNDDEYVRLSIIEHGAVVKAMRERDSKKAAAAMALHLKKSAERIQKLATKLAAGAAAAALE